MMSTPAVFTPIPVPDLPDAACKGISYPDVFYPEPGEYASLVLAQAKSVCAECPVRVECLAWAIEHKEEGTTGKERRKLTPRKPPKVGCIIAGCELTHQAHGLCGTHYSRIRRTGSAIA